MAVIVCLLRAVNLGGRNSIRMDTLRSVCESLDLRNPETYVQSGNVVFGTKARDLGRLARRLEDAIEQTAGFRPDVMLRTANELRGVIARNPFAKRRNLEPSKLLVVFLERDPGAAAREKLAAIQPDPEEFHLTGRELYIYYPDGMGRSKLSPLIDKAVRVPGTGRNWNTVTRLLEIATRLEASR